MQKLEQRQTGNTETNEDVINVLIADTDPEFDRLILEILARKGIRGHLAGDRENALNFISKNNCGLVFVSDSFSCRENIHGRFKDGLELVGKLRENLPELPIIMTAGSKNIDNQNAVVELAVESIRRGCCEFLLKPAERKKIENLLDTFIPNHSYSTIASSREGPRCLYQIVGRSPKLYRTVDLAKKVAPTSAPILLSGESGTGKEVMAYLIHHHSRRSQRSYIRINCAALSDSLLESELFGHEKGAFTGAYTQRIGRFEMAHGGTLLLDEITETPITFQAKLLRVLEQQDFERVGGNESIRVDVRIISTTNRDLLQEVNKGRFRQDLYYRLSAVRLSLCPLRERLDDLPDLVWYFINLYCREVNRRITELDPAMMEIFANYHWPGNIRQLRNVVRTCLILGMGPVLSLADVSWLFDEMQPVTQKGSINNMLYTDDPFSEEGLDDDSSLGGLPLEQVERRAIMETLRQTGGNQTKAAKVLGISDRTLRERIHRYRKEGCLQAV
ncbi:MAG: sigma-54-dependent Fis family transcriptional regulator [Sedimentisphaerales bacterium]|nr:sigma-54-dependent Fis family transcriptional regulator [Sedimentisphaerales bacterium]